MNYILCQNLKKVRVAKKLTQNDFAKRLGTTRAKIGSYEELRAVPPLELVKLCFAVFNIPENKLWEFLFLTSFEY